MKTALISGITGQDGRFLPNSYYKKDMKFTVFSAVHPHSIQDVSNTCTSTNGCAT